MLARIYNLQSAVSCIADATVDDCSKSYKQAPMIVMEKWTAQICFGILSGSAAKPCNTLNMHQTPLVADMYTLSEVLFSHLANQQWHDWMSCRSD